MPPREELDTLTAKGLMTDRTVVIHGTALGSGVWRTPVRSSCRRRFRTSCSSHPKQGPVRQMTERHHPYTISQIATAKRRTLGSPVRRPKTRRFAGSGGGTSGHPAHDSKRPRVCGTAEPQPTLPKHVKQ